MIDHQPWLVVNHACPKNPEEEVRS